MGEEKKVAAGFTAERGYSKFNSERHTEFHLLNKMVKFGKFGEGKMFIFLCVNGGAVK